MEYATHQHCPRWTGVVALETIPCDCAVTAADRTEMAYAGLWPRAGAETAQ